MSTIYDQIERVNKAVKAAGWYPFVATSGGGGSDTWRLEAFLLEDERDIPKNEGDAERLPDIALEYFTVHASSSYTEPEGYRDPKAWETRREELLAEIEAVTGVHYKRLADEIIAKFTATVQGGEAAIRLRKAEDQIRKIDYEIANHQRHLANLRAHKESLLKEISEGTSR